MEIKMSNNKNKKFITPRKSLIIKKKLLEKGLSQRKLAKELGISAYWMWLVINGKRTSPRVIEYLEKKLGVRL